jgi:sugar-specific transcriptional regulator TrmB
MHKGTLEEMIQLNNEFESTIPALFGMPPLENNIAEGFVFHCLGSRHLLKSKSSQFSEVLKKKKPLNRPKQPKDDEQVLEVWNEMILLVNENRLDAVKSKECSDIPKPKLVGLLARDVLEEFVKFSDAFDALPKEKQKIVKKKLSASCQKYVLC